MSYEITISGVGQETTFKVEHHQPVILAVRKSTLGVPPVPLGWLVILPPDSDKPITIM